MSATVTIPIAGFKDVYEVPAVEKALQELPPSANEALRAIYEKMLRLGGQRFTVKPSALPEMDALFDELPNFTEVLEDIRKHLALCVGSNDSIELPIDASGAVWLATANDASRIPEPLVNRLTVYEIEAPDDAGSLRIARTIYGEVRNAHDWGRQFPESPSDAALEKLAGLPPREMRRAIQSAFGNAKLAGHSEVGAD